MKLGFIGTGEITKAVVIGVLGSKIKFQKIYLSKRNSKISAFLTKKNKKIQIEKNNQDLINKSDWVFLAVTPKVGNKIIKKLHFKSIRQFLLHMNLFLHKFDICLFWPKVWANI